MLHTFIIFLSVIFAITNCSSSDLPKAPLPGQNKSTSTNTITQSNTEQINVGKSTTTVGGGKESAMIETLKSISINPTTTPAIPLPAGTGKVTYSGNSNTGGTVPIDPAFYRSGETVTVLSNSGSLVRSNFVFEGWNTQADGRGITYTQGQTFDIDSNSIALYAQWRLTCNAIASGGTWVPVPGDSIYGTSDFCIMKYFASNVNSNPVSQAGETAWTNISQTTAKSKCSSYGGSYHLITNPEWMTLAANAAKQGFNWSGGSPGNGQLARGHTDNMPASNCAADTNDDNAYVEGSCTGASTGDTFEQRRTHYLSNGSVVWDLNGNYWEWVNYNNANDMPNSGGSYIEYTSFAATATTVRSHVVPQFSAQSWWNDSWTSAQSIGKYYPGTNGTGEGAMARGGGKSAGSDGGLFSLRFNYGANDATLVNITFRCVFIP